MNKLDEMKDIIKSMEKRGVRENMVEVEEKEEEKLKYMGRKELREKEKGEKIIEGREEKYEKEYRRIYIESREKIIDI